MIRKKKYIDEEEEERISFYNRKTSQRMIDIDMIVFLYDIQILNVKFRFTSHSQLFHLNSFHYFEALNESVSLMMIHFYKLPQPYQLDLASTLLMPLYK